MFTFLLTVLLLLAWFTGGFGTRTDFDAQLARIVKSHSFSIAAWEVKTLTRETIPSLFSIHETISDASSVREYFDSAAQVRILRGKLDTMRRDGSQQEEINALEAELAWAVERKTTLGNVAEHVIEYQIRATLAEEGIRDPVTGLLSFPPVDFKLTAPPELLVVSPRDRIQSMREIMLQPDLSVEDMESIEVRVDGLGVSSLVTGLGGFGVTYPTFVSDEMDLRDTINTACEEWIHQYLVFRPLGFRYVLDLAGLVRNYDIATMNETLATMVGKEIGELVYDEYYTDIATSSHLSRVDEHGSGQIIEPVFDFNAEMRRIRVEVDRLLSQGKVDEAEQFMKERRDYLESQGYYIRKLNQAYFAFYGTYADSPTSIDPIGEDMEVLRARSTSLKEFLDKISVMTSRATLEALVR